MLQPLARYEVRADAVQRHLFATSEFQEGETILIVDGVLVDHPSRYSLQVGEGLHVDMPPAAAHDDGLLAARYAWRFLNHSCAPSAVLRDRALVALRPIAAGEEITFDYDTTEYAMAEPFRCHCGACDGREIGGFSRLSQEERAQRAPLLSPHLKRRLDAANA